MNLKNGLAIISIGFLAAFGIGCGDACDDAIDKLEECGVDTSGGDGDSDVDCSGDAEKFAECINDADCDAIKDGSYLQDC